MRIAIQQRLCVQSEFASHRLLEVTVAHNAPDNLERSSSETWRVSRSGAWASRGFDFQHLISTLILVRQWAGLAPSGYLVPEGVEDCVIESSGCATYIQEKSRKAKTFGSAEVRNLLDAVEAKATGASSGPNVRTAVVLEQPCAEGSAITIDSSCP